MWHDRVKSILGGRSSGDTASHFDWTYFRCIAVAVPLLLCAGWAAFGQSVQPGHLRTRKQTAPMTPAEEKNLAFVLQWWREVVESRHTELAVNYAADDFIQHNPNIPTGRAALLKFFQGLGPAIDPIPDRLANPRWLRAQRGISSENWSLSTNSKNPKTLHSQSMNTASICFAFKTGRYRSTGILPGKNPVQLLSFLPRLRHPSPWVPAKPTTTERQRQASRHDLRRM